MKNEKGFILPTTIAISLLFFVVFTHQLDLYLTEKRFYKEVEEQYVLENVMSLAVDDIVATLVEMKANGSLPSSFSSWLYYPNGQVRYHVVLETEDKVVITLYCETANGRKYNARFIYDFVESKGSDWIRI